MQDVQGGMVTIITFPSHESPEEALAVFTPAMRHIRSRGGEIMYHEFGEPCPARDRGGDCTGHYMSRATFLELAGGGEQGLAVERRQLLLGRIWGQAAGREYLAPRSCKYHPDRRATTKGLCPQCYNRWKSYGHLFTAETTEEQLKAVMALPTSYNGQLGKQIEGILRH